MKKLKNPINLRDIQSLLAQLKAKDTEYPASLLAARRADFLAKAANMQPGDGKGPNNDTQARSNSSPSTTAREGSSTVGKSMGGVHAASQTLSTVLYALVGILTTIILAEVTYLYREEIRELFLPGSEEVVSPATLPPLPSTNATPLPYTASPSPTTTISTPPPLPTEITIQDTPVPGSTSAPPPTPIQTKPGNRLGHTKTPGP